MKKKILVVEDDKKVATALEIRLRAAGYEVIRAGDGLEGLRLAATDRPNLVVMDIWMPEAVGVLTAQRLKHIGLEDVPVIFLTAGKKKDLWPIAKEVDPAGFFEKPYDSGQLLAAIGRALEGAASVPARKSPPTHLSSSL